MDTTTTDPTDTTEPVDSTDQTPPADTTEQTDLDVQDQDDDQDQERGRRNGNSEAAKYRRQLRDSQAETEALRDRVTTWERRHAEQAAAAKLADPADLWAAGVTLDDLRGDDGDLDPAKIDAALDEVLAAHPHWYRDRKPTPKPDTRQGGGHSDIQEDPSWSKAIRRR